ncbi:hypothetical protein Sango_2040100 [Sesamum angolense]|uniref:RNase H type-1 domain-containing protein n=1 Tax=Sesamum angolense TaxID=2727404 RepID=A0AAE1WG30_9LAMI|nr:hypothetical protein Sango_2040100 [Sesamum angolense]
MLRKLEEQEVVSFMDSQLVPNQFKGMYEAKDKKMKEYLQKVKALVSSFKSFSLQQILRTENERVDALSKFANLVMGNDSKHVTVSILQEPSLRKTHGSMIVVSVKKDMGWEKEMVEYLTKRTTNKQGVEKYKLIGR